MKSRKALAVAVFIVVLLAVPTGRARQSEQSDEAVINSLKAEIQRLLATVPPKDSPNAAKHKSLYTSAVKELQKLLLQKAGALKYQIQILDTKDARPTIVAYVKDLKTQLDEVNGEIRSIDQYLDNNPSASAAPQAPGPASAQSPAPTNTPLPIEVEKKESANRVQAINDLVADPKKLTDAAAPKVVATSATADPGCTAGGAPAAAKFSSYDQYVCSLARDLVNDDRKITLAQDKAPLFTILIAKLLKTVGTESYVAMVTEAQEARVDQQVGSGSTNSGTTSLVTKGGVPFLLGFAVENGAAVKSQSGTTMTFRINPAGLLKTFENKGFITQFSEAQEEPLLKYLGKTSVGLSFDTDRGSQPGIFTGDKQQLSVISARFEFLNERDPRNKKYAQEWEQFSAIDGLAFAKGVWAARMVLEKSGGRTTESEFMDPALQAWLIATTSNLDTIRASSSSLDPLARINALAAAIRARADLLPVEAVSKETVDAITAFALQLTNYTRAKNKLLDKIAKGRILTLEYTNNRAMNAPDTSNFNFIAATGIGARVDLTANGSFTFFNKLPVVTTTTSPRTGRIRDFQFAGQVDIPFPIHKKGDISKKDDNQFDFWFSGRYERLMEDASTMAGTMMPNTRGDIAVGQFGLNIPLKSLGIKFPISVTFANRTEFVKEKVVRGNFGFTFNWDTLLSKIKPL
jgi:hypothetical protein